MRLKYDLRFERIYGEAALTDEEVWDYLHAGTDAERTAVEDRVIDRALDLGVDVSVDWALTTTECLDIPDEPPVLVHKDQMTIEEVMS